MQWYALTSWVFFVSLGGAAQANVAALSSPTLSLTWVDPHQLFSFASARIGENVESLFDDVGCDVRWQRNANEELMPGAIELKVVLMPTEPTAWGLSRDTMGVVMSRTDPQRALYVFFSTVARTLGYEPRRLAGRLVPARERRVLVRALARVITHEVFHAIAPALPHADGGVTQHRLDRDFLTRAKVSIHFESAEIFREELGRLAELERKMRAEPPSFEPRTSPGTAPSSPARGVSGTPRHFGPFVR